MEKQFDAFISYSRTDDRIARSLQRALESQVVDFPGGPKRRLRIFLDRSDMSTGVYFDLIAANLAASGRLIVLCSPAARASHFVNDEISRFLQTHPASDVVPVLVGGDPGAAAGAQAEASNPIPERLLSAIEVPALADLRNFKGHWRRLRHASHAEAWYAILSQLTGVPRRELEKVEQKRVRSRWMTALVTAAAVIAMLSTALLVAIDARREALLQRAVAEDRSRALVSADIARHVLEAKDSPPDRDLLLGAQAASVARTPLSLGALLSSLERHRHLAQILRLPADMLPPGSGLDDIPERIRAVASSQDGGTIAAITEKHWVVWNTASRERLAQGPLDRLYARVDFAAPGRLLLMQREKGATTVFSLDIEDGQAPRRVLPDAVVSASVSEAASTAAFVTGAGVLSLWDTRRLVPSTSLARKWSPNAVVDLSADGKRLTVFDGGQQDTFAVEPAGLRASGPSVPHPQADQDALIRSGDGLLPHVEASIAARLGAERTSSLFDMLAGMKLRHSNRRGTLTARLSPQGDMLLAGTHDGVVSIFETEGFQSLFALRKSQYDGTVNEIFRTPMGVSWSADGNTFVAGYMDGDVWVMRSRTGLPFATSGRLAGQRVALLPHPGSDGFNVHMDGAIRAVRAESGGLVVVDAVDARPAVPPSDAPGRVYRVVESGGADSRTSLLERLRPQGDHYLANSHDDPDGSRLFIAADRGRAALREVAIGWGGMVVASGLSGDQSTFAIAKENGTLSLIDTKTATVTASPVSGTYGESFYQVKDLAISSDGRTVWWVNGSRVLRKWTRGSGQSGTEDFREFDERLTAMAMSRDGTYLMVGDSEGGLRLVDAATLASISSRLGLFFGQDSTIERLAVHGDQVAVQSGESFSILDLGIDHLVERVCQRVGRGLTAAETQKYMHDMAVEPPCGRRPP